MITKIISGGQTGADRAALDAAIEYGIPHGGWVPRGRRTENGRLPDIYRLKEGTTIDYSQRTELNVLESNGTLIFYRGELRGGSALTQEMAKKHGRSCLLINLEEITEYQAVGIIKSWIDIKEIDILNVAGSRASEDPLIYNSVKDIIKSVLYPPPERIVQNLPGTVEEALELLLSKLSFKDKTQIAKADEEDLPSFYPALGLYIRNEFGLFAGNNKLMEACRNALGEGEHRVEEVSEFIIKELWKRLKKTHALRMVK